MGSPTDITGATIDISSDTVARLKMWAEPLEDDYDSTISKVLDAAESCLAWQEEADVTAQRAYAGGIGSEAAGRYATIVDGPVPHPANLEIPPDVFWALFDERRAQFRKWGQDRDLPLGIGLAIIQEELSETAESLIEIAQANANDPSAILGYSLAQKIVETGETARALLKFTGDDIGHPAYYEVPDVEPDGKLYDELTQVGASVILMMAQIVQRKSVEAIAEDSGEADMVDRFRASA